MPRTDRGSRVIAAPPEHVYAALVNPEALTAWLPPAGMTGRFERFDARPGGSYRLVLTYADASGSPGKATAATDIVDSRFIDLVRGVRVVQAVDFVSDDPTYAGTMTMTWEVTEVDGGTRVDIVAENVPDGIAAKDHAAGLASSLMNLAEYVEGSWKTTDPKRRSHVT
ncbi:MAG: SRPBCC family protein [Gaiellaceae bacterium]